MVNGAKTNNPAKLGLFFPLIPNTSPPVQMFPAIFEKEPLPSGSTNDFFVTGQYGKTKVRVARILRNDEIHHDFQEFDVECLLEGDINTSFSEADNSVVVPTDTVKNTVYMVAIQTIKTATDPEDFAKELNTHLLDKHKHLSRIQTTITVIGWKRLQCPPINSSRLTDDIAIGSPHPHTFLGEEETYMCRVRSSTDDSYLDFVTEDNQSAFHEVVSGIKGLRILKTTQSGFTDYIKDDFTTLEPTTDRILSTYIYAKWAFASRPAEGYSSANRKIKTIMLQEFVGDKERGTYSPSVQGTMNDIGCTVLSALPSISKIDIELPNVHYIPFRHPKLKQTEKNNDVLIGTAAPSGLIRCRVTRDT